MEISVRLLSLQLPVIFIVAMVSVSCTKNPPKLDSNKPLQYSFKQPERTIVPAKQSAQLGQPDMKSVNKNSQTYYSANGNICRRLSNNRAMCYIGGRWYEASSVIATGR